MQTILKNQYFYNMNIINEISQNLVTKRNFPEFKAGYNITVYYKIKEGNKERTQFF